MDYPDISKQIAEVAAEYRFHKPPEAVVNFQELMARVWRVILDWLDQIFHIRLQGASDSRSLSNLMQVALYVIGAAAIVFLIYYLWKRASKASRDNAAGRRGASQVEELLDALGWKNHAAKMAASGDYRGACRGVYLSLLQALHEAGVAEFAPTKTNYEYGYILSPHPDIQRSFKRIANEVEVIWFGNRDAESLDYEQALGRLQEIEPEIKRVGAKKRELEKVAI